MNITEIRNTLSQLIEAGNANQRLWDSENPTFAVCGIVVKHYIDTQGDADIQIRLEFDEVKNNV